MIILGKVRPLSRHLTEAHPQVSIIARWVAPHLSGARLVVKFWWLILMLSVAAGAGVAMWCFVTRWDARLERQHQAHAALVARADQQHAWILAGDDRGVHGDYQPAAL